MPSVTALYVHAACCIAYFMFAAVLPLRSSWAPITFAMMLAAMATSGWSAMAAAVDLGLAPAMGGEMTFTLQLGAWLAVILTVLYRRTRNQNVWLGLALAMLGAVFLRLAMQAGAAPIVAIAGVHLDAALAGILMDILGLVLIENL